MAPFWMFLCEQPVADTGLESFLFPTSRKVEEMVSDDLMVHKFCQKAGRLMKKSRWNESFPLPEKTISTGLLFYMKVVKYAF